MIPEALQVDELVIRRFGSDDVTGVLEAVRESGADLTKYETWAVPGFAIDDAAAYVHGWILAWDAGESFFFAIYRHEALVGASGLFNVDRKAGEASFGFWIRSSQTGMGFATSAGRAVVGFGLEHLQLHRIEMIVATGNAASLRVCEKIGASREGLSAKRLNLYGVRHDAVVLAVIAPGS